MKTIIVTIILLVSSFTAFPQEPPPDTIYHFTRHDTLFIFDQFEYNCACGFKVNIVTEKNHIKLYCIDTIPDVAYCVCGFQILTAVTGLSVENYQVDYYRVDKEQDTIPIYSFSYCPFAPGVNLPMCSATIGNCGQVIYSGMNNGSRPVPINLYPNPANEILRISWPENMKIDFLSIKTIHGIELYRAIPAVNLIEIPFPEHRKGVFLLHLKAGNQTYVKKFIVN